MIKYLSKKLVKAIAFVALLGSANSINAQGLTWSQAGPVYNAGRSRNMIIDKNDPSGNTLYVGSASSGVFVSTNGGSKWSALPLINNQLNVSYIAQAVDGTIYVATGEGFLRPGQKLKAQPGTGLYKIIGSAPNLTLSLVQPSSAVGTVINRVACSPSNPQRIAIATNLGILTSTDGGATFNTPTGFPPPSPTISGQDLKFNSSGILYCSAGNELGSTIASLNEYSRVYRSTDNSLGNFLPLTNLNSSLLQDDHYGRIELAIAPSNNSVIYASCASKYTGGPSSSNLKGLFVSYDAGDNWGLILQGSPQLDPLSNGETCYIPNINTNLIAGNGGSISSGDYAHVVTVHPTNPDELYIGSYQFYTWVKSVGTNTSNPVGTWNKYGCTFLQNTGGFLPPNIHDIKFVSSGSSISRYYFVTDAGIYRSVDALLSFQPFYKGLVTGQFNSVSIERFPLANVPATQGSTVTPYVGFIGGTGGNGLNYYSALNDTLVTEEVVYTGGDVYESEFSKILPNAAYFTQGLGKLFRTTDVRSSQPTQVNYVASAKTQSVFPFDNGTYGATGTPFKMWESYGQTTASPDSVVFYNDTLRFSASMVGVNTLTTQTTFSFSAARPGASALIDSIVVRTGTVVLPISAPYCYAPSFTGSDKKDVTIKLPNNYTVAATGTTNIVPGGQTGPVVTASTSVVLNATNLLDNINVTFNAPPFLAKNTASYTNVPDAAAYYRVFCTVFYKYKTGDSVTVVDDKISTKTYTYSTVLTRPLKWGYGDTLSNYYITANNSTYSIIAVPAPTTAINNPTYVLMPGNITQNTPTFVVTPTTSTSYTVKETGTGTLSASYTYSVIIPAVFSPTYVLTSTSGPTVTQSSPNFTVKPITTTAYTITSYGTYTASAKPVTYTLNAVPAGTASISNPTYVLTPGNFTQTTTAFVVTPTTTTNYIITETGTGTLSASYTYSTINSSTYNLMPGNVTQASPVFTITTPIPGVITYTMSGISSNTLAGANTTSNVTLPAQTFTSVGYFATPISLHNTPVKIANYYSARLAVAFGANVYVSNAPLSLNNPLNLINISSNKCLTTDASGNKLSGASNTVAISGTVTALEWSKSGTELYYATNDPLPAGSGNSFLYRVSYIDALLDSTAKDYSGKLHTNVFTFSATVAPDGTRNNPRSPYRTALLGTFTTNITSISVTNDNMAIAVAFNDVSGSKIMYSTVADVRKCDFNTIVLSPKDGTGLTISKIYCTLMEMSDNKKVLVGTDKGVYYTNDITSPSPAWLDGNGGTLQVPQLPRLQIFDLKQQVMKPSDCYNSGLIYAATNGRGVFVNKQYFAPFAVSVKEFAPLTKTGNNLSLFPNPTSANVSVLFNSVNGENATINIMDISGKLVKQENMGKLNSGQTTYSFDTSELPSGMYIVGIHSDSGIKRVAKLIVTK